MSLLFHTSFTKLFSNLSLLISFTLLLSGDLLRRRFWWHNDLPLLRELCEDHFGRNVFTVRASETRVLFHDRHNGLRRDLVIDLVGASAVFDQFAPTSELLQALAQMLVLLILEVLTRTLQEPLVDVDREFTFGHRNDDGEAPICLRLVLRRSPNHQTCLTNKLVILTGEAIEERRVALWTSYDVHPVDQLGVRALDVDDNLLRRVAVRTKNAEEQTAILAARLDHRVRAKILPNDNLFAVVMFEAHVFAADGEVRLLRPRVQGTCQRRCQQIFADTAFPADVEIEHLTRRGLVNQPVVAHGLEMLHHAGRGPQLTVAFTDVIRRPFPERNLQGSLIAPLTQVLRQSLLLTSLHVCLQFRAPVPVRSGLHLRVLVQVLPRLLLLGVFMREVFDEIKERRRGL